MAKDAIDANRKQIGWNNEYLLKALSALFQSRCYWLWAHRRRGVPTMVLS